MIHRLFVSDNNKMNGLGEIFSGNDAGDLGKMLEKCLAGGSGYWLDLSDISAVTPFIQNNDSVYSGKMTFALEAIPFNNSTAVMKSIRKPFVEVYVLKRPKTFNDEQVQVWEVVLGDIY
jgi:hypothetical protein